jgi:hypothetical protein
MSNPLERATTARSRADEEIRRIQADKDLTMEAKGRRIKEIREKANNEVSKLKATHAKEKSETRDRLHRRVFGLSFKAGATETEKLLTQANYRDALFRADGLQKPEDALRMFGRAQMIDDKLLMKAIAAVSYEQDWGSVLNDYASTSPDVESGLQELQQFEGQLGNRQAQFRELTAFSGLNETPEEAKLRMSGATMQAGGASFRGVA